jgi:RNA polymerase sigma-70 factor (ECF subfamily)
MQDLDDETLMQSYQKGDYSSFTLLYRRYSPRIYGYLKSKIYNQEERDEVFQQIFLKVHRSRDRYSAKYKFIQWLFVIARTVLIDHFRKAPKNFQLEEFSYEMPEIGDIEILNSLGQQQKEVVTLRVIDELSFDEIAKRLNKKAPNVRQIFSRSLKKLKYSLGRVDEKGI